MKGYRTYIALAAIILNNILKSMGFTDYPSEDVTHAIDVLLAVIAFFFRYKATK
jgi:hypothetical protein